MKKSVLIFTVVFVFSFAVFGITFGIVYSLYYESPPAYRPMVFYDGKLFWDESVVETQPDTMNYIGKINSVVPDGEKPNNDFECNSEVFMNAKLYRDINGNYYLRCKNGNLLLLETSGVGRDALITPSKISSN